MPGINRAITNINKSLNEKYAIGKGPCIFLSHRSLDKDMVDKIAKYIMDLEIDVYYDKNDEVLQAADARKNDEVTTKCIQNGVKESTHILCILSPNTVTSWWVPYEIGYGENMKRKIFSIRRSNLEKEKIPAYLRIRPCLMGWGELENYLDNIIREYGVMNESQYFAHKLEVDIFKSASMQFHPLSKYFDK